MFYLLRRKKEYFCNVKLNYSKNFWIIAVALFFYMISFNLLLPEMNEFISDLGGENYKGLIIALFTIFAGLSRPFSGKLSDLIGRKKVMMIGMIIGAIITALYPFSGVVLFFLSLRLLHGFSAGFLPTGATALVSDVLAPELRGRGMGIWGVFISLGIGIGQYTGTPVKQIFGLNGLFMIATSACLFSGVLITLLRETLPNPQKFKWSMLKIQWDDAFDPSVMPAAVVMFLSAVSSGIIFVVTPDMGLYLNIENKGWFFGVYVLSTILIRAFGGGISDKIGRRKTLIGGMIILIISMTTVAFCTSLVVYTAGAVLFGVATGIASPTLFAWTADLSKPERRGVGSGTLFIALEFGILLGALSTLVTYNNTFDSIPIVFLFGSLLALFSLLYLIWHLRYRQSNT